ncbi:C-C motif chemokine 20-like [Huso huso]|uniref:C-C motif chemokine 20-like n=1 Tax=Huso huso TaxID=61971 RepID=A0ABR0ZGT6_HUSHU
MSNRSLLTYVLISSFILSILIDQASAYGPHKYDCCINYTQKPVPIRFIKGYMEQSSLTVCSIDAIIFLTVQDKKVCANSKDAWVKSAMRRLSYRLKQLSKKSPGGNGDGKRAIPGTFTAIATPAAP